jgi:hypothetical protein
MRTLLSFSALLSLTAILGYGQSCMRQMGSPVGPSITNVPSASSQSDPPHSPYTGTGSWTISDGKSQPVGGGDYQTCGTGSWTATAQANGEYGAGRVCPVRFSSGTFDMSSETPYFKYTATGSREIPAGSTGPFSCDDGATRASRCAAAPQEAFQKRHLSDTQKTYKGH